MKSREIAPDQTTCDMTVVPGGIMVWAGGQAAREIRHEFATKNDERPAPSLSTDSRSASSPPAPDNRLVTLSTAPLSRRYESLMEAFKSAYAPLRQFLVKDSFAYEAAGNTCTTLFFNDDAALVAFCSTKCSSLKIKGDKILSLCPAVEIAALCVDDRYRYTGIGQAVIREVIQQISGIRTSVGVQLITLFAVPDAVAFYQKLDFRNLADGMKILYAPAHRGCKPMYLALPQVSVDQR